MPARGARDVLAFHAPHTARSFFGALCHAGFEGKAQDEGNPDEQVCLIAPDSSSGEDAIPQAPRWRPRPPFPYARAQDQMRLHAGQAPSGHGAGSGQWRRMSG